MLAYKLLVSALLLGCVSALDGLEPLPIRRRRCAYGDCTVYLGGRNTGRISGARVVEGAGSGQPMASGDYGYSNAGNAYGQQLASQIRGEVARDLANAAADVASAGAYGNPQYGNPQYGNPQYGNPPYGTGRPTGGCAFGPCSVNIPGNNDRDINL